MNHPKKILATLTVALTLAVVPTAFADDDPRLPPPQCPFLGGCTTDDTTPPPDTTPTVCGGLGQPCLQPAVRIPVPQPDPIVTPEPPCQEGEPCWDCTTMGNKICGGLGVLPVTL